MATFGMDIFRKAFPGSEAFSMCKACRINASWSKWESKINVNEAKNKLNENKEKFINFAEIGGNLKKWKIGGICNAHH